MAIHYYKTEQFLPIDIDTSWDFFSSPKNLALITPPALALKILTSPNSAQIHEGMLVDYTVRPLWGLQFHWKTQICRVNKPFSFIDKQLEGPYKLWEHLHEFVVKDNGVLIKDLVTYQLAFGMAGDLIHSMFVRKKIEDIFLYRKNVLKKLFEGNENNH